MDRANYCKIQQHLFFNGTSGTKNVLEYIIDILFIPKVIQWMLNPTETSSLKISPNGKNKCLVKGQAFCSLPNSCPLTNRELSGQTLRLHTCLECPSNYPWIQVYIFSLYYCIDLYVSGSYWGWLLLLISVDMF